MLNELIEYAADVGPSERGLHQYTQGFSGIINDNIEQLDFTTALCTVVHKVDSPALVGLIARPEFNAALRSDWLACVLTLMLTNLKTLLAVSPVYTFEVVHVSIALSSTCNLR